MNDLKAPCVVRTGIQDYAAIDLGSNSFHMIVARNKNGDLKLLDRLKIMARLASHLDSHNILSAESIKTALDILQQFEQRIREIPSDNIRAVGTSTFRRARNSNAFLPKFNKALGHPIEVISGIEEARLIYQGVAHSVYNEKDNQLVVDIGGGSTELIIGKRFNVLLSESIDMGAASHNKQYFDDGVITAKRFRKAKLACQQQLKAIEYVFRKMGWKSVIGASGTVLSIHEVISQMGYSGQGITKINLDKLIEEILSFRHIKKLKLLGLSDSRKPVFIGGIAVLSAIFESLQIECMLVSGGALREGLLYDLIGRQCNQDIRDETVKHFMSRYGVSVSHVEQIEKTIKSFFYSVQNEWGLRKKQDLKVLQWATRLHSIGLSVAHSQYAKHGAYLLANSDMPGFSRQLQAELAVLVRSQHRKLPKEQLRALSDDSQRVYQLCILLRLAILFHRSRAQVPLSKISIRAFKQRLTVLLSEKWLQEHPLTQADLDEELGYWSRMEIELDYKAEDG